MKRAGNENELIYKKNTLLCETFHFLTFSLIGDPFESFSDNQKFVYAEMDISMKVRVTGNKIHHFRFRISIIS